MVKKVLTPVLLLVVCAAAQGQRSFSSGSTSSSQSYNTSASVSRTSSSEASYHGTSSYSSTARYTSAGGNNHSTGTYRYTDNYSPYTGGNTVDNDRYQTHGRYSRNDAYMLPASGAGGSASVNRGVIAPARTDYLVMDDKYALTPIPKTVPSSNENPQRGLGDIYPGNGSTGGGLQVNPFYTPGFSGSCGNSDDSHNYQIQFMNFVQGRSLYGLPWNSWVGRRYIYWNYWNSKLRFMCQESLTLDLARAKTPAEIVEVMRSYHRCLRTIDADGYYTYYNRFYPSSGGWRW